MEGIIRVQTKEEHWYESTVNLGTYYPSVTTILQEYPKGKFFERYLANLGGEEEARSILKEAGERGTRVHEATEKLEDGETLNYCDYQLLEWLHILSFIKWYSKSQYKSLEKEYRIVSDELRTGGTIDRVCMYNGKLTILDFKTSKSAIHDSYWLQLAAYAWMYEQQFQVSIDQVTIVRFTQQRKDGYEEVSRSREEWLKDLEDFKHIQAIWVRKNPKPTPGFIDVPLAVSLKNTD